jgi:hypothetical protein
VSQKQTKKKKKKKKKKREDQGRFPSSSWPWIAELLTPDHGTLTMVICFFRSILLSLLLRMSSWDGLDLIRFDSIPFEADSCA